MNSPRSGRGRSAAYCSATWALRSSRSKPFSASPEVPSVPRPTQAGYPDYDPGERPWNRQGNFNATNRNKLGLTLDLTTEQGVSAFKELVNISDIVFTNYAFGVMDRLGIGA